MARDVVDAEIIEFRDDLVAWLAAGGKPAESFRIGVEHEKFPFYTADLRPVPYEGERGVRALLEGAKARLGWAPIEDRGRADRPLRRRSAAARSRSSRAASSSFPARRSRPSTPSPPSSMRI